MFSNSLNRFNVLIFPPESKVNKLLLFSCLFLKTVEPLLSKQIKFILHFGLIKMAAKKPRGKNMWQVLRDTEDV
jgi:hypothetical protein